MSNQINYINTQEIRQDLMGFLQELAAGRRYVVLNRSKPVVTLSGSVEGVAAVRRDAKRNIKQFLVAAEKARNSAKGTLDSAKSYKQQYAEDMAEKYGVS